MPEGFTARAKKPAHNRQRVFVTGATGNIGSYFAEHSHKNYELRLMVRKKSDAKALEQYGEIVIGDIDNLPKLTEQLRGTDTVVHMAAMASPSTKWPDLLQVNIVGTYNVFVAAKAAGCRRVIYASSIHAVSGYPADVQVKSNDPVNPGDMYGVTKCFGEALGRYMAMQEGLSTICLRIGGFQPLEFARDPKGIAMLDAWVSQRDLNQLLELCIDKEDLRFAIFNGLSDNRFKRLDISDAREILGYAPVDDMTALNPKVKPLDLSGQVMAHNLGDGQESAVQDTIKEASATKTKTKQRQKK